MKKMAHSLKKIHFIFICVDKKIVQKNLINAEICIVMNLCLERRMQCVETYTNGHNLFAIW